MTTATKSVTRPAAAKVAAKTKAAAAKPTIASAAKVAAKTAAAAANPTADARKIGNLANVSINADAAAAATRIMAGITKKSRTGKVTLDRPIAYKVVGKSYAAAKSGSGVGHAEIITAAVATVTAMLDTVEDVLAEAKESHAGLVASLAGAVGNALAADGATRAIKASQKSVDDLTSLATAVADGTAAASLADLRRVAGAGDATGPQGVCYSAVVRLATAKQASISETLAVAAAAYSI